MFNRLQLSHRILILVVVPLIFELALVGRVGQLLSESEQEARREAHARAITENINRLLRDVLTSAAGVGAFVISKEDAYTERTERDEKDIWKQFDSLEILVKDESQTFAHVREMRECARQGIFLVDKIKNLLKQGNVNTFAALNDLHHMRPMLRLLTLKADAIIAQQHTIEVASPQIQEAQKAQLHDLLMLGAILNVVLAISLAIFFNKSFSKRLGVLMDNSMRFAISMPLHAALTGTDELARLDQVFHKMAQIVEESARKERAVIENALDVICSIDAEEKFSAVSPASLTVWGYEPSELLGRRIIEIILPADREATRNAIKELIEHEEDKQVECRVTKKDGSTIDVVWSMHWSPTEKSLFGVAHDITERKKIERLKQEFVAMVSHDLRTPLSAIKGTLSLLAEGVYDPKSPTGKSRISDAEMNIDRLVNLISDLLDIEKLEAGSMQVEKEIVNLSEVVDESIAAVRGVAEKKQISLTNKAGDADVIGDSDRLVQVLINLLSNAIKFSPEKSDIEIEVNVNNGMNEVRVIDHGRGISPNNIEIVFERFKQVQTADGKRGSGTGLGLAICKAIVEAHSGQIGVESKEGVGSTFWFKIPKADKEEATPVDS